MRKALGGVAGKHPYAKNGQNTTICVTMLLNGRYVVYFCHICCLTTTAWSEVSLQHALAISDAFNPLRFAHHVLMVLNPYRNYYILETYMYVLAVRWPGSKLLCYRLHSWLLTQALGAEADTD